ncbi:hypothetical protein LEP1GSC126_3388 [Leptospira kirschneri str. 200801774]|nr:hypothetical protein LEP1GSC126_3388 [Leptospira kirschneri str. 200801774]
MDVIILILVYTAFWTSIIWVIFGLFAMALIFIFRRIRK